MDGAHAAKAAVDTVAANDAPAPSSVASDPAAATVAAGTAAGAGTTPLPEHLAVRRIELSWVREQRRRARQAEVAALHIQRIYRGRLGRRRVSAPHGDPVAGGAMQNDGASMVAGAASSGVMTAASYHRQKLRATKQRADGWRPPGLRSLPFWS